MKNIFIIVILLFTVIACNNDYLEKYPLDEISEESFWRNASDIELYANQFYTDLDPQDLNFRVDDQSDNQGSGDRNTYIWNEYTIPTTGGGWTWEEIRDVNYGLVRIDEAGLEGDDVLQATAELRFFRAYYYVKKVKKFGDVPWYDKDLNIDDTEALTKARDDRKDVFANILEDLDFAAEYLPEESSEGRLTKYAALCFKSEACLYEGTFRKYHELGDYEELLRESADAAETVMNSSNFSLYSTGNYDDDYFDLFVQYELEGNPEAIMFQNFIADLDMHDDVRQLGEQKTGYTKDFVNSYLCTDGLPISLSSLYQGDAEFGDEFKNRDPRMYQSIYSTERPYRIYEDGSIWYKDMPEFDKNYCMTSYFIIKEYSPYEVDRYQWMCVIDRFIFRYGEILITYAEAKAELGEATQEVLDKSVNLLRDRVGMPHLTVDVGFSDPDWPDWEVPVSPLINEIRRERRIELCNEGNRWDDLVRWKAGKRLEDILTYRGARDPDTDDYRDLYPGFTRVWDNKLYLYPIPTQELTLNSNLEQNPGWGE